MAQVSTGQKPVVPPYPVSPLHQYFPPWPPTGGTGGVLATSPPYPPSQPNQPPAPVLPVENHPPSGALFFRFAPGVKAVQIQTASWACRKIVFFAPSGNALSIFIGLQGISNAGPTTMEIPPGGSGVIDINDIILVYFVAGNATDIITGWAESFL